MKLNLKCLKELGGINDLEKKLKTNYKTGLTGNHQDIEERIELYGKNEVHISYNIFIFLCFNYIKYKLVIYTRQIIIVPWTRM